MSRVYFHSPTRTAELRGSERAWLASLVTDISDGIMHLRDSSRVERLRSLVHPDHYMARKPAPTFEGLTDWARNYSTAFAVGFREKTPLIQYKGQPIDQFAVALNTAARLGNDQIKLAARLHGQCEIHAWVAGPNRTWLADIMQAGLDSGVYRHGIQYPAEPDRGRPEPLWVSQGWDDVIELLRERDDEPVVTSYSVCDQFPNSSVGDWMPPWPKGRAQRWDALTEEQQQVRRERSDAWYDLESAEQWRIAMEGLQANGGGLEMNPAEWLDFRFAPDVSLLDLFAPDWEERLERALTPDDGGEQAGEDR